MNQQEINDGFFPLDSEEVISVDMEYHIGLKNSTCTVEEFLQKITALLQDYASYNVSSLDKKTERYDWFTTEGVPGNALRFGQKGWQSGWLRLAIEFCPDEPDDDEPEETTTELPLLEASVEAIESPLDEIRRLAVQ